MPVKRAAAGPSAGQKRTRFTSSPPGSSSKGRKAGTAGASAEDDVNEDLLEEDLPEGGAKARQKVRRSLKDQDGYGSDSSNDDEGVVPSRRPGAKNDEEDVDMFADEVEEKDDKGKAKAKEFMDLEDFEGQEFGGASKRAGSIGDSEDEEVQRQQERINGLDGDMGVEITPFNMKDEMEEGRFTADGETFVRNDQDPNDRHDTWLTDLDESAITKARQAHLEREKVERERQEREEGGGAEQKEKEIALMRQAVDLMQRGETVLEALQRSGKEVEEKKRKEEAGQQKKKSWVERQKERKVMMAVDQEQADPTHTSNPFTNLSNIVSGLTTIGHLDVYSLSRESIQRMLPALPATQSTNGDSSSSSRQAPAPPPPDNRTFQYRFSLAYMRSLPEAQRPVERELFGPFSVMQLRGWRGTGFFGSPACENVELRLAQEGAEPGPWGSWADIVG